MLFEFNPGFFDKDGLLRTRRITEYGVPETKDAFNGLIYTSYLSTLMRMMMVASDPDNLRQKMQLKYDLIDSDGFKKEHDYSHDDMTGIVCAKIWPYEIKWSRYWYRAESFLYLYCAGRKWAKLFFPILSAKMIFSHMTKNKAKNGSLDTDGPLLAWVIYENFDFPLTKKICVFFNKVHFGKKWLSKMFEIKFSGNEFTENADHPCRVISRAVDGL